MREILDAIYGLLISPEAEDPLDRWDLLNHTAFYMMLTIVLILACYLFFVNVFFFHLLRSILAEEFLSSKDKYEQEAKDHTAKTAAKSFTEKEQVRFPSY